MSPALGCHMNKCETTDLCNVGQGVPVTAIGWRAGNTLCVTILFNSKVLSAPGDFGRMLLPTPTGLPLGCFLPRSRLSHTTDWCSSGSDADS